MTHKKNSNTLNRQKNKWNEVLLDDWGIPVIWEAVSTNKMKWLQISKTTAYSGRMIAVWILILAGIFYLVSASNIFAKNKINTDSTTNTNVSCPMANNTTSQWRWCGGSRTTTTTPTPTNTVETTSAYETINVWHNEYALVPETVTLTADKSYKLVITPTADGAWCMNNMTIPGLDNNIYPVKKDTPVTIVLNNVKAGTYEMVCGNMWMRQGTIVIQ